MFAPIPVLFAFSVLSGAFATPLQSRSPFAAGAAYFLTNDPSGNAVITSSIASDGSLALEGYFSTNGAGMRGDSSPGPDAIYSQGSVVTHQGTGLLAAVNPGSNTVTLFQIDPTNPWILTPVGEPVSSGGEFPISAAFNHAGNKLCVLNSGATNGVQCFNINAPLGLAADSSTTRSLGMKQTTPPVGPPNTASQLIFTEDDSQLVVAVKGENVGTPGYLTWWDVLSDGSLSQNSSVLSAPEGGAYPFSLTPIPGRNAFLSTDYAIGVDIFDMTNLNASATTLPGEIALCWSAWSPRTGNYYVTDTATGIMSEFAVDDKLQPSLVEQFLFPGDPGLVDLAVASLESSDYLYILGAGARYLAVLDLTTPNGPQALETIDLVQTGVAAEVVFDPAYLTGMAVYVKS